MTCSRQQGQSQRWEGPSCGGRLQREQVPQLRGKEGLGQGSAFLSESWGPGRKVLGFSGSPLSAPGVQCGQGAWPLGTTWRNGAHCLLIKLQARYCILTWCLCE